MNRCRRGVLAVLLLALFGLVGCSLFTTTVNETDVGSIQTLDIGDILSIELMGNATTGYEWARVSPASLEGTPLDVISEDDYQALECDAVGGPGKHTFRYRAMRPGTIALDFEYRRPWEPESPVDSYTITIWIR